MNDNNPSSSEERDQQHISQLYAELKKAQPSKKTDEAILHQAQLQAQSGTRSATNTRRQWRKWQWPASIAASVMFVSVIVFTQYRDFSPSQLRPTSLPADPYAIADQATLDESAARERAVLETKTLGAQRPQDQPTQSIAQELSQVRKQQQRANSQTPEPQKSNFAEQEARGLAAKAMEQVAVDINIDEFQVDALAEISPLAQDQEKANDQDLQMGMQADEAAQSSQSSVADIVVTGARISEPKPSPSQSSYLLSVADKLKQLKQLSSPNEQQRSTMKALQNDLVDYLLLVKTANSNIQIGHEYLDLLTPEQAQRFATDGKN